MNTGSIAVVIPTYNRRDLLARSLDSVLSHPELPVEVIVVDDCGTDGTAEMLRDRYPGVLYLRAERNGGPCAARNLGLERVVSAWAIMLDDDDELVEGALSTVAERVASLPGAERYPVVQFRASNGNLADEFVVLTLADILSGKTSGDFTAVVNTSAWREGGWRYDTGTRVPSEHFTWWRIARAVGLPTWKAPIVNVGQDAPDRLTGAARQMRDPRGFAELQEATLKEFLPELAAHPAAWRQRVLGAATYRLLAGDRQAARRHLSALRTGRLDRVALGLWALSFAPLTVARWAFTRFRAG
ncbi:MAG TPA: glycosyltransferase family 2 protein [Deinococcales bacterium]|nr:glycosyltransferase family 2 protein [Deinococcales bacterium]